MGENMRNDITEIMTEDRSNRDTIEGFREYRDHLYRSINHRLWDISINISDIFIYLVFSYDLESSRFHILLHYSRR
jgi:hypothetical protein